MHSLKSLLLTLLTFIGISSPFDGTIWNNPLPEAPAHILHGAFHSPSMNVDVGYNVLLPADYEREQDHRYPVVFFLHGRGGDENSALVHVKAYIATHSRPKALIVFPNGGKNSKYLDALPGSRMRGVIMTETMIMNELIPHIDASFRTERRREARAIQGFSMGGLGALRLAFKHPEAFGSVYAIAPALDDTSDTIGHNEPDIVETMLKGQADAWARETPAAHLQRNPDAIRSSKLAIEIDVGADDELRPWVEDLSTLLGQLQIPHRLRVIQGRGHTYELGENFDSATKAARM